MVCRFPAGVQQVAPLLSAHYAHIPSDWLVMNTEHYTALYCNVLHCLVKNTEHYTALYCNVLHCLVMNTVHCTALVCTRSTVNGALHVNVHATV